MRVALLNTSIITNEGTYEYKTIGLENAKALLGFSDRYVSHVGHESTAQIMAELLGIEVPMSRLPFAQEPKQLALVCKLNGRPPEGRILSRDEIETIGYTWGLLQRLH